MDMQRGSLTREASVSQADRVGISVDRYRKNDQLIYVMYAEGHLLWSGPGRADKIGTRNPVDRGV